MKKMQKGFTLIELLVVVAIIAILALIVMLAINPVEMARRSRDSRRLADLATLRKAVDLSLTDNKTLTAGSYTSGAQTLGCSDATNFLGGLDVCKYLSTLPQDPRHDTAGNTQATDGTGCGTATPGKVNKTGAEMIYTFTTDGDTYEIDSFLESTDNCTIVNGDGGNNDAAYEIGTKIK